MGCKSCGRPTAWGEYVDEDGFVCGAPEDYCELCYDRMAEREQKRREWDHYHPGEPCPDIELGRGLPVTTGTRGR